MTSVGANVSQACAFSSCFLAARRFHSCHGQYGFLMQTATDPCLHRARDNRNTPSYHGFASSSPSVLPSGAARRRCSLWSLGSQAAGGPDASCSAREPSVPLRERLARYSVALGSLQKVYEHMLRVSETVGDSLADDGGPDARDLEREMGFMWEDALEGIANLSEVDGGRDSCGLTDVAFRPMLWRDLKPLLAGDGVTEQLASCYIEARLRCSPADLRAMWERRVFDREPLQYLTASADWRDFVLSVGPGVLIPRPETELLIDLAEEFLATPSGATRAGMPWADLGTGSGALAVGLARSPLFKGRVVAVDVSPEAMRFTRYNAARLGVSETVEARLGKWWAPLEEDASLVGRLGGLLSNPPYIPAARLDGLQAEVKDHEPHLALDGGVDDGMRDLRAIVSGAARMLAPSAFLGLETDGGPQAHMVASLVQEQMGADGQPAFQHVRVMPDYGGTSRFVTAVRR